ncbi:MAG: D-hexose-6-phosphate mutarotase [Planctomycetes bacterium]|nr:D-hexose-6-phosphate mutarotase [Planctomycetota bacterium]MCB9868409.1 D-hexose-6-phosphate mutarotase [Planctomycetota bacterium]
MLAELNDRFAIPGILEFTSGRGSLPMARVASDLCAGEVYLHGAHVTGWRPRGHDEVLWVSRDARFERGTPIRGGVPICWPWFGQDPTGAERPGHGFARIRSFTVTRSELLADGRCAVDLTLRSEAETQDWWNHEFDLTLTATFGTELDLRLRMENRAREPVTITAALHTYLSVAAVEQVSITGLSGLDYLDKTRGFARFHQDIEPRIQGEVDRVYLGTDATCEVTDPGLDRRIRVGKRGSHTTVLWNPGVELAARMTDLDGHGQMLCIEAANAAEDAVHLDPGAHHTLGTTLAVGR